MHWHSHSAEAVIPGVRRAFPQILRPPFQPRHNFLALADQNILARHLHDSSRFYIAAWGRAAQNDNAEADLQMCCIRYYSRTTTGNAACADVSCTYRGRDISVNDVRSMQPQTHLPVPDSDPRKLQLKLSSRLTKRGCKLRYDQCLAAKRFSLMPLQVCTKAGAPPSAEQLLCEAWLLAAARQQKAARTSERT